MPVVLAWRSVSLGARSMTSIDLDARRVVRLSFRHTSATRVRVAASAASCRGRNSGEKRCGSWRCVAVGLDRDW
eukprot:415906-Pleurochrysis_carterae.AAC.2